MLSPREIVRLRLNGGDEITVEQGTVWLTLGGRDFIVKSGQTFEAPLSGEVLLQGLGETFWSFRWQESETPCPKPSWGHSLLMHVQDWLQSGRPSGGQHPRAI